MVSDLYAFETFFACFGKGGRFKRISRSGWMELNHIGQIELSLSNVVTTLYAHQIRSSEKSL